MACVSTLAEFIGIVGNGKVTRGIMKSVKYGRTQVRRTEKEMECSGKQDKDLRYDDSAGSVGHARGIEQG